jgi:hypothetical protein
MATYVHVILQSTSAAIGVQKLSGSSDRSLDSYIKLQEPTGSCNRRLDSTAAGIFHAA